MAEAHVGNRLDSWAWYLVLTAAPLIAPGNDSLCDHEPRFPHLLGSVCWVARQIFRQGRETGYSVVLKCISEPLGKLIGDYLSH